MQCNVFIAKFRIHYPERGRKLTINEPSAHLIIGSESITPKGDGNRASLPFDPTPYEMVQNPLPRKGTETVQPQPAKTITPTDVQNPLPRKGTETSLLGEIAAMCDVQNPLPRKGTEMDMLIRISFQRSPCQLRVGLCRFISQLHILCDRP